MKQLLFLLLFLNDAIHLMFSRVSQKLKVLSLQYLLKQRYSGSDNFLGRTVKGYESPKNILTNEAIDALTIIQKSFLKMV